MSPETLMLYVLLGWNVDLLALRTLGVVLRARADNGQRNSDSLA